jgi:hypothetical protein
VGETRVDLLHLLEDLRDAYPGPLEETIVSEIVANALDSGAATITLTIDQSAATLTVADDGRGMSRGELRRYHDLAASTKVRGTGIGFAGVGIKLGLLACGAVLTETRRGRTPVATTWHLAGRHRAPWQWVPPPGLVGERGTTVRLTPTNPLSPLLDAAFLAAALRRHYRPLFDPACDAMLTRRYPHGVRFTVNGRVLDRLGTPPAGTAAVAPLAIRVARRRTPSALGQLRRSDAPLPEDERGVAVSALGKVIKSGWDWLGLAPQHPDRVSGLIECPALAACLTLNKGDFVRAGPRGAIYLAHRKAIQEAVAAELRAWGEGDAAGQGRRPRTRPLERDLQSVLLDLADQFPLLGALVGQRRGGQRKLPFSKPGAGAEQAVGAVPLVATVEPAAVPAEPPADGAPAPPQAAPATPPQPRDAGSGAVLPGARGPRRPAHSALAVRFEHRPGDPGLGRLVESTVWVNEAHPAFQRAAGTRAEAYHVALATALALAPLAVDPARATSFVTAFLARWGAGPDGKRPRRRRRDPGPV